MRLRANARHRGRQETDELRLSRRYGTGRFPRTSTKTVVIQSRQPRSTGGCHRRGRSGRWRFVSPPLHQRPARLPLLMPAEMTARAADPSVGRADPRRTIEGARRMERATHRGAALRTPRDGEPYGCDCGVVIGEVNQRQTRNPYLCHAGPAVSS